MVGSGMTWFYWEIKICYRCKVRRLLFPDISPAIVVSGYVSSDCCFWLRLKCDNLSWWGLPFILFLFLLNETILFSTISSTTCRAFFVYLSVRMEPWCRRFSFLNPYICYEIISLITPLSQYISVSLHSLSLSDITSVSQNDFRRLSIKFQKWALKLEWKNPGNCVYLYQYDPSISNRVIF